jgi:Ca2+-binding RTX toxin-like protein
LLIGDGVVSGTSGADLIDVRVGGKTLAGGSGSDTYIFGVGYGNDLIQENGSSSDVDVLRLANLNTSDLIFTRSISDTNDVVITVKATGEVITIDNQISGATSGVEQIQFADGTVWDSNAIIANTRNFIGTALGETINGTTGNDIIVGNGGNDTLHGNSGNDTYVYAQGDGDDLIQENGSTTDFDVLRFSNLNASDLTFTRSLTDTNDLVIVVNATGERITVDNQNVGAASAIEQIQFADGTTWDANTIAVNSRNFIGTAGVDTVNGTTGNDTITGNGGNDTLHGNGGNDTYVYARGDGNDLIQENGLSTDADVLRFSDLNVNEITFSRSLADLNDLIITVNATGEKITIDNHFTGTGSGIEQIQFANGSTWDRAAILANAWVRGTAGADSFTAPVDGTTIIAGSGDDTTNFTGSGSDTIVFAKGDGHDVLDNTGSGYVRNDTLNLTDILPSDVVLTHSGDQMIISVPSTGDTFTVKYQFFAGGSSVYGINNIKFADGTVWNRATILANAWVRGTTGADSITAPADGVTINPGRGDDTTNLTGSGSDTILFAKGDGHDVLNNTGSGYVRNDTLNLTDILSSDVVLTRSGDQMTINVPSTGDTITVKFQFFAGGTSVYGINNIKFADGTVWNRATILANAWVRGTAGADSLTLPSDGVTVVAGQGNDTISVSGNGSDTFIFAKGDGHDVITNPGSGYNRNDTLNLTNILPSEVVMTRSGDLLTIDVPSTGDQIKINFQFWGDGSQIQGVTGIKFADGTVWNRAQIKDATSTFTWVGSASNQNLVGNDFGLNIFQFGAGSEIASGGAGKNIYQVSTGTGQASINLSASAVSKNEIDFLGAISDNQLWFVQSGNDLKIDLLGTSTQVTLDNWFAGGSNPLQEIVAGGLKLDSQLSQLVQAMASYTAGNPGFDPTSANVHTLPNDSGLQNALAAAWHS